MRTLFAIVLASFVAYAAPSKAAVELYQAQPAVVDPNYYGGSGGHAFWLPTLVAGNADKMFIFPPPANAGTFIYNTNTGLVSFSGSLFTPGNSALTFDFQITFIERNMPSTFNGKRELKSKAYKEHTPSGPVDTDTWTYFDMVTATLTGTGTLDGAVISLKQRPANGNYPYQLGIGASGKNILFGFSGWFDYTVDSQATAANAPTLADGYGDININLQRQPTIIVSEPAPIALFALMAGLALYRTRRRTA